MPKSIPSNKVHEVCKLLQAGEEIQATISRITGVSLSSVNRIANRAIYPDIVKNYTWKLPYVGVKSGSRRARLTDETIHRICRYLEGGELGRYEIARKCNVSHTVVRAINNREIYTGISKDYIFCKIPSLEREMYVFETDSPADAEWKHLIIDGISTKYDVNQYGIMRNRRSHKILRAGAASKHGKEIINSSYAISICGKRYCIERPRLIGFLFVPIPEIFKNVDQRYLVAQLRTKYFDYDMLYSPKNIIWMCNKHILEGDKL